MRDLLNLLEAANNPKINYELYRAIQRMYKALDAAEVATRAAMKRQSSDVKESWKSAAAAGALGLGALGTGLGINWLNDNNPANPDIPPTPSAQVTQAEAPPQQSAEDEASERAGENLYHAGIAAADCAALYEYTLRMYQQDETLFPFEYARIADDGLSAARNAAMSYFTHSGYKHDKAQSTFESFKNSEFENLLTNVDKYGNKGLEMNLKKINDCRDTLKVMAQEINTLENRPN